MISLMLRMVLSVQRRFPMFPLTRTQLLKFAAVGAFATLTAGSTPALADEMVQNFGPVGPHEPIITTVGSKRVIAFYAPSKGGCEIEAVVWDGSDTDANG